MGYTRVTHHHPWAVTSIISSFTKSQYEMLKLGHLICTRFRSKIRVIVTSSSRENIRSSSGGAQEKGKTG
jgi:hypothetical protein